ncbi:winged helix-turn-helix transcriptional regulator [Saccharothrix stipae]
MSGRRDYGQFCGMAAGLNIIGERWTLLIVRELLIGPVRFNEMIDNLPGIGPNLLSERLRSLSDHGVIEQLPVPGDGRGKLYQLTDAGRELRGPLLALARWGMAFLDDHDDADAMRAEWGFLAVQAMIIEDRVPDVDEVYEFRVGDQAFAVEVADRKLGFSRGRADRPNLLVTCAPDTFIRIGARLTTPFEALATGGVKIEGPTDVIQRCVRMLGLADPPPPTGRGSTANAR